MIDEIKQESLWMRIKRLFGHKGPSYVGGRKLEMMSGEEVDAFMEKMMSNIKNVPYMEDSGSDYRLRFNLANMVETGWVPIRDEETKKELL